MPIYCGSKCQKEKGNRDLGRGAALVTLIQGWRVNRGRGEIAKAAFAEVVSIVDQFNADDKAAGRPRADLAAAKLLATGIRYIDRRKKP